MNDNLSKAVFENSLKELIQEATDLSLKATTTPLTSDELLRQNLIYQLQNTIYARKNAHEQMMRNDIMLTRLFTQLGKDLIPVPQEAPQ